MSYAITDIILWAKCSQAYAAIDKQKGKATSLNYIDDNLDVQLYVERKSLEYAYAQDPTSNTTFLIGQWVLSLCGAYLFQAQAATGSGGSITPVSPSGSSQLFPIYITNANFTTATFYPNTDILGNNIIIFLNELNRYLIPGTEFSVSASGITIINTPSGNLDGFDATVNTYNLVIEKYNN